MAATPWLAAPFRPFYLLGVAYAVALMALTGLGHAGVAPALLPFGWHGHEMIFGFTLAIVTGTVLTALPSWAGSAQTQAGTLAALAGCWLIGRAACLLAAWLPWPWVAAADLLLPLAVIVHLAPRLARLGQRRWLLVLVVFAAFALANGYWHAAAGRGDAASAASALRAALWVVVMLFALAGGLFTPAFTAHGLAARGLVARHAPSLRLELAAGATLLALAVADVGGAPAPLPAVLALAALALQGWRVSRWQGWLVRHDPLLAAMHLGFAWLLAALALKALVHLGLPWPGSSWVHAFTVGALASMMLGLMTRVVLRHTGRPLVVPRGLPWWLLLANAGALLRVAAPALGPWAWAAAACLWALAFAVWLVPHAPMLWRPSLPRAR